MSVQLSPLEIATGLVFGGEPFERPRPRVGTTEAPLAALERALLPSLLRRPCLVSFSGGRDSSSVLAAATHVARREGLPLPIPATNRFAGAPTTDETEWQELVVSHLRLDDWIRLDLDDELDAVGPYATQLLRRHGLQWPFNAHFHAPLLEAANGGSLITGIGGDEVFGESSWARVNDVLAGRVRPEARDVLRIGAAFAPGWLRRRALARREPVVLPWLRARAIEELAQARAGDMASEPRRYAHRMAWWQRRRWVRLALEIMDLVAGDAGATIAHPLMDPTFGAAIAHVTRRDGPAERGAFMAKVFGELLPRAVYGRGTKATFDQAFWGRHSQELVRRWNGEAVDPELVDVEALRAEWTSASPDAHSFTLLQAAWLELEATKPEPAEARRPARAAARTAGVAAPTPAAPRA